MKRFMSLFLALVMSLALAVPALADEPGDGSEGIMPLLQIFPDNPVTGYGGYRTVNFSATPGNGKTIHMWFQNDTDYAIGLYLYRADNNQLLRSGTIPAQSQWSDDYIDSEADSLTYYVVLELRGNYLIDGRLAVAQYA